MKTQIVIHLLPTEIDDFEWQVKQLKLASFYLNKTDTINIDVTLNLNLVDWKESKFEKQYFVDKFNNIKKLCNFCEDTIFEIDENNKVLGCDDKRRQTIRKVDDSIKNIIYLDCDIIFTPETLKYILDSTALVDSKYYIISPQITKAWDNTWDCLVNNNYLNHPLNYNRECDPYETSIIKFGGGWFNLLSTNLLKFTDIPDSFGPYGVDDTYVMMCSQLMKNKRMDVQQYVIENLIVSENYKYRFNPYENYLKCINKKDEYRKNAEANFSIELNKFYNKLNNL
jgi:hypothetical protein